MTPSTWAKYGTPAPQLHHHYELRLVQGFPNWSAPDFIKNAAVEAITKIELNQYTRMYGYPPLLESLATYDFDIYYFSCKEI